MTKVTLPWPPAALSSNARGHWAKKAAATKKYRADARILTVIAKPQVPAEGLIPLTIRFVPPHNRFDAVNLPAMIKAGIDGFSDAIGVNDKRISPVFTFAPAEKPGRVEITVGGGA